MLPANRPFGPQPLNDWTDVEEQLIVEHDINELVDEVANYDPYDTVHSTCDSLQIMPPVHP